MVAEPYGGFCSRLPPGPKNDLQGYLIDSATPSGEIMRQMISSVESDCVLYVGRKLVYRCLYICSVEEKKLPFIYK